MKIFTKNGIVQKIVIVITTIIVLSVSIPTPVHADAGGRLFGPIFQLLTAVVDAGQYLLESLMLHNWSGFLKSLDTAIQTENMTGYNSGDATYQGIPVITTDKFINSNLVDHIEIPQIKYSPEEIFSNRVPALDVNFIDPSVEGGSGTNIARALQPTIASWYVALRTLAIVGLLSVLIYIGIRMLLSSVASDKAKYKKMLMDWVIALCLVFVLHYIMAFTLTITETITSMIAGNENSTIWIRSTRIDKFGSDEDDVMFKGNLMSYVRFMTQSADINDKIAFLALYIMLFLFTIRFTWTYLKRVVNMAFLTLIAPLVALSYPIDKISDGKAQAFNIWLREYIFNALIQPLHLLLYTVLLGTAIEVAVINPLYAVVALGFIFAAEKLVKQMFGFGKASGGTVGTLASAVGLGALASRAISGLGRGRGNGNGNGGGKVRTQDGRQGRDQDSNTDFNSYNDKNAIGAPDADSFENTNPSENENNLQNSNRDGSEQNSNERNDSEQNSNERNDSEQNSNERNDSEQLRELEEQLDAYNESDPYFMDPQHRELQGKYEDLVKPDPGASPIPDETNAALEGLGARNEEAGFFSTVWNDTKNFGNRRIKNPVLTAWNTGRQFLTSDEYRKGVGNKFIKGVRKNAIRAWRTLPAVGRGALKTATRLGVAGVATVAGAALMGDAEKAIGMGALGFNSGGGFFEQTAGRAMKNHKSVKEDFGAAKYGSKQDYRNAQSDKAFLKSAEFNDYYEKYFKDTPKKDVQNAFLSYRQVGITDKDTIRKAMKLEEKLRKDNSQLSAEEARGNAQNIVQNYNRIDQKAFVDPKIKNAELKHIENLLPSSVSKDKAAAVARTIFKGMEDYRNI